jgi:hypothetical protein
MPNYAGGGTTVKSACRCIERAIERIQHPNERPTMATVWRWASMISAESWKFVEADFRFVPVRSMDFVALFHVSTAATVLENVREATDADLEREESEAQKRGDRLTLAMLDSIRSARRDPSSLRGIRESMSSALRELRGEVVLVFVLRAHKATILNAYHVAELDPDPFLAIVDGKYDAASLEAARASLARLRRISSASNARVKLPRTIPPNLDGALIEERGITWTPDYGAVWWGARMFEFPPGMARRIVGTLLEAWALGRSSVDKSSLADACESQDDRFSPRRHLPRAHPALGTLIVAVGRGSWKIAEPRDPGAKALPPASTPMPKLAAPKRKRKRKR